MLAIERGLGFLATVIGVFCYSGLVRGFFATVLPGEGFLQQCWGGFLRRCQLAGGFLQQSHGGFLRRCRLAGGFFHQSHGGFLHQFSRPDKATLKQQKLQLENFGFSVFPHIPRRIKKLVLVAVVLLPREDDHDSGLCFEPVVDVVVVVVVPQIAIAIGVLTSNRGGGRRTTLADWTWHQGASAVCSGRGAIAGCNRRVPLLGAIVGCHCNVLWLGGG